MKETIILAPSVNEKELLQSLALRGRGSLGVRIVSGPELAELALMRSGIPCREAFLNFREQVAAIFTILQSKDIAYFATASYADAENIARTLNDLRGLFPLQEEENITDVLSRGEFPEKNTALLAIYRRYCDFCTTQGRADGIARMRRAIAGAKPLNAVESSSAGTVLCALAEYPCTPLEEQLLSDLSGGGAVYCSIRELFPAENSAVTPAPASPGRISRYTAAYGASNEIADILAQIDAEALPLDNCVIAAADPDRYAQLLYDFSATHMLPMTFGCGIPILNTNPGRLLKAILAWKGTGCCGTEAWRNLAAFPAFERTKLDVYFRTDAELPRNRARMLSICGSLRLGCDHTANQERLAAYRATLPPDSKDIPFIIAASQLAAEFEHGYSHILRTFCRIRKGPSEALNKNALSTLCEAMDALHALPEDQADSLIALLLTKSVCAGNSTGGALHVTTISGAMSSIRQQLFVVGLSADVFPGAPRENYLLLDSDLAGLPGAPTSEVRVRQKRREYDDLLKLYAALGCDIRLSFPSFDPAELKSRNVSSTVLDTFRTEHGRNATDADFLPAGYYDHIFSVPDAYGREYKNGRRFSAAPEEEPSASVQYDLNRVWSPTAIEKWMQCPRRFYYHYVLRFPEQEEDDPYTLIDAATTGTLAHEVLENLTPETTEEELRHSAERVFDDYLAQRPPVNPAQIDNARDDFLAMMENGWQNDPRNTPLASEEDLAAEHPSGVTVHGKPDRVERTPDGKIIVVDYKTGRKVRHQENDFTSCFQALVYAYILENRVRGTGNTPELDRIEAVDHVEFRYPRADAVVSCVWNPEMKELLSLTLQSFREGLEAGNYSPGENCDPYCPFTDLCPGKTEPGEGDTE